VRKNSRVAEDAKPKPPTRAELEAARGKTVKDIIRPGLDVLFVGINPGLYTAAIGHHFGRPGNRFWPSLNASGLLRAPLTPQESRRLLESNVGITNIVDRATAAAAELTREELRRGARRIEKRILRLGLYRDAFDRPEARVGLQRETIGRTLLWVFPNPSGLNAHFQVPDYARLFRRLASPPRGKSRRLRRLG